MDGDDGDGGLSARQPDVERGATDPKAAADMQAGGPEAESLSDDEWLVLFAMPVDPMVPGGTRPLDERAADPVAAPRESDPLTRRTLAELFRGAGFGFLAALRQMHASNAWILKAFLGFEVLALPVLLALLWTGLNAPASYGRAKLIVGLVGAGAVVTVRLAVYFWTAAALVASMAAAAAADPQATERDRLATRSNMLFRARWIQLQERMRVSDTGRVSVLLVHDPLDGLCSCPRCASPLIRQDVWFRLVPDLIVDLLFIAAIFVLLLWTPAVVLPGFWSSWGVVGFAFAVFHVIGEALSYTIRLTLVETAPGSLFARRMVHRALSASLRSFVRRCRAQLAKEKTTARSDEPSMIQGRGELHVRILTGLDHDWTGLFSGIELYRRWMLVTWPLCAAILVASLTVGPCICSYQIAAFAFNVWTGLREMLVVASFNLRADDVSVLCHQAALAADGIAVDACARGTPDPAALEAVRGHARLLRGFAASLSRHRGRILGAAVSFGTVRVVAVTLVTVGFALIGAMRGFRVTITLETVCT